MKAMLFKGGDLVAEIEAPDPAPPRTWARLEQPEIVGMELDNDTGVLTLSRATHDVFALTSTIDGVARYDYEKTE